MNLEKITKVLVIIVIIIGAITLITVYQSYETICKTSTEYQNVQYITSSPVNKICGRDYGVTNTGETDITIKMYSYDHDRDDITSVVQTKESSSEVVLQTGESLEIVDNNNTFYVLEPNSKERTDHQITLNKF